MTDLVGATDTDEVVKTVICCGDVNTTGSVDGDDVWLFRDVLAGISTFTAEGEARCTVIGVVGPCDILDLTVIRRTVEGPDLPPGIAEVCAAAMSP